MKETITIFWLIPVGPERELFRDVIRILAQQFDAPRFDAHLTLCRAGKGMSTKKLLRQICSRPVQLRVRGVVHSPKFTKTLFVRFAPNESLRKLVAELGGTPKSLPDPHVSLLYKKLAAPIRRELCAAIKLPFQQVTFDAIKAVRCEVPCNTRRDVERWRVIATKRLSGKRSRPAC